MFKQKPESEEGNLSREITPFFLDGVKVDDIRSHSSNKKPMNTYAEIDNFLFSNIEGSTKKDVNRHILVHDSHIKRSENITPEESNLRNSDLMRPPILASMTTQANSSQINEPYRTQKSFRINKFKKVSTEMQESLMVQIKSPHGRNEMKLEPIVNESEMIEASYDLGHKKESAAT